jgi:RHS repeat-associated protein
VALIEFFTQRLSLNNNTKGDKSGLNPYYEPDITEIISMRNICFRYLNKRQYEQTDHLSNLRLVHEDFKYTQLSGISPNIVNNGFKVEPINWYNTYVFGMPKSGESADGGVKGNFYWDKKSYRFGFNGKENDNEVMGTGNFQDYGFRMYNSRLGRFISVDPLANIQPGWSPYKAFLDNPIIWKDPTGASEDYFKDPTTGEITWHNTNADHVETVDGKMLNKIGTSYLSFNGSSITLHSQVPTGPVTSYQSEETFTAVSGMPLENGNFDYSANRQLNKSNGPLPEQDYNVPPGEVAYNTEWERVKDWAIPGKSGGFPGGEKAWGNSRFPIYPSQITLTCNNGESIVRNGFTIHGGTTPGSAGCIDLTTGINSFRISMLAAANRNNDWRPMLLRVDYSNIATQNKQIPNPFRQ